MIIRRIDIDGFGPLKDVRLQPEDGLTNVPGVSEKDALAVQAFVTAVLYGMEDEEREAYLPEEEMNKIMLVKRI